MPSATYRMFRLAILGEKQVTCIYQGRYRELCPHILGHTRGEEKVLAFQFGGTSKSRLPQGGEWRCFVVADVHEITLRDGPWHSGRYGRETQRCVEEVELDVNIHVRKLRSERLTD